MNIRFILIYYTVHRSTEYYYEMVLRFVFTGILDLGRHKVPPRVIFITDGHMNNSPDIPGSVHHINSDKQEQVGGAICI